MIIKLYRSIIVILDKKIIKDISIGFAVAVVFSHILGIPIFLLLLGFSFDDAFAYAGWYMLLYNLAGGVAFTYIAFFWILYPLHRDKNGLPSLSYLPGIALFSYFLYCFVHLVMIRDLTVVPSPGQFLDSYLSMWLGILGIGSEADLL